VSLSSVFFLQLYKPDNLEVLKDSKINNETTGVREAGLQEFGLTDPLTNSVVESCIS
jgi:hypothetical protein